MIKKYSRLIGIFFVGIILLPFLLYIFYSSQQEKIIMNAEARKNVGGNFIKLSQGITHYELKGPDTSKLLVLIHGGSTTGYFTWEKNYYELVKAGVKVLRFDLYGRGYSDKPNVRHSLDLFTNQLKEILDSLGIKKPVHLAGVSMGGNIAINFMDRYPDRVDKLILFDPAAINPGRARWYLKSQIIADFMMTVLWVPRAVDKQMAEFYDGKKLPEYEDTLRQLMKYKGLKHVFISTWLNVLTENLYESVIKIGKQKKDVLLFWGKQDKVIPITASKRYIDAIPGIKFVEVDKAGHVSNYERADTINPIMIDFIKK